MMATNGCPEVLEVLGSSSEDAPSTETPGLSSLNATALRERRQRKKLRLKKLEKRLEILDRQIKKCAEAEVSLDEMNSGYSAYIKEDLLKRKFVKTWQELCELQHVSDSIVIEDREGYEGTPYPEVNRRVQRLLRLDEFPDYMDIVQLLERCNLKHSLSIGTEEKGQLARKVFKDVGKMMKRSRHRDFVHHFGSHLTDTFYTASDPAEQDEALLKTLQESLREGEKKMEAVVEEFAVRQEHLQETSGQQSLEGDSCSANEEEDEEDEEEEQEGKEGDAVLVEDESGFEMDVALQQDPEHPTKIADEEEEGKEEVGVTIAACSVKSEREPVMADSTTVQSESPLVTSTHQQQDLAEPGPSGLSATTTSSHISSTSDVVCLDDDEEDDDDVIIVLSDSDPA